MDWRSRFILLPPLHSSIRSIHGVVHGSSFTDGLPVYERIIGVRLWTVALSVFTKVLGVVHNAASDDAKRARILCLSVLV